MMSSHTKKRCHLVRVIADSMIAQSVYDTVTHTRKTAVFSISVLRTSLTCPHIQKYLIYADRTTQRQVSVVARDLLIVIYYKTSLGVAVASPVQCWLYDGSSA